MDTVRDSIPETDLDTYIDTLRTLVGTERFDQAEPGMTLRPSTTALLNQADVGTLKQPADAPLEATRPAEMQTLPQAGLTTALGETSREPQLSATFVPKVPPVPLTPPAPSDLTFARDYTLHKRVGKGGMGEVFLAGQNALRREVAIKKIIPEQLKTATAQKMEAAFISEALVTGFLDHPNIVPVHGLGRDDAGQCYFAMKLVRGIEWRHLLHPASCKDAEAKAQALARNLDVDDPARRAAHLPENLRILLSVCNAVAFAHSKHIIHRDLKPENVMVGAFGEVLTMDWGLAADVSETPPPPGHPERRVPPCAESGFGGTPSYMAPEQFAFDETGGPTAARLGCWTDVFLLGGMLYELLSGHPPYFGCDLKAALLKVAECAPPPLPESVPPELALICRKALSKNPLVRYPDALAFQKAVQDFLTHREAALIAAKAEHEAKTPEIPNLARAVVLYAQALELWPANAAMAAGHQAAKTTLAVKEGRARWIKRSLIGAAAAIVLGLLAGILLISAEQKRTEAAREEADQNAMMWAQQREKAVENELRADYALRMQRILSFEAVVRNAEADEALGKSAEVIQALTPYIDAHDELTIHELMPKAKALVVKANDGFKHFAAFQEKIRAFEKNVSLDLGNGVMLEMVLITPGKFKMGGSPDEIHVVEITKPFYIGKYSITQQQFETIMRTNPSFFQGKPKNPVEGVDWFSAVAFCEKINKQSGPVKTQFSLPTEAQWEFACRAGTQTEFYFGDEINELKNYAWIDENAGWYSENVGPKPIGLKLPNAFGLYDMHGNVYQWCRDWWGADYYKYSPHIDPLGPREGTSLDGKSNVVSRVIRGGCFMWDATACRSGFRTSRAPALRDWYVGFRVALSTDGIVSDFPIVDYTIDPVGQVAPKSNNATLKHSPISINATLTILNYSSVEATLYWLNGNEEKQYSVVPAGKQIEQGTYVGHTWRARLKDGRSIDFKVETATPKWVIK